MNKTTIGRMHTIANVGKPELTNSYSASKNRRKSNNTLPPFSLEYVLMIFAIIISRDYSLQLLGPSEKYDIRSC